MAIHATAVVHADAEVDPSCEIGPYCIVGPHVRMGAECKLLSHVVVDNDTIMGARNVIHPFASVGGIPQDLKFAGERARLVMGDDNVIREGATLNIGTEAGGMDTTIGSGCLIMAYAHVAHDCHVGNHVILANAVGLAGHVELGDYVIAGGSAGIHQFCRVGRHAFLGGGAMVAQDVPPFCLAQGDRAQLVGINVVGLRRSGWTREGILSLREAFTGLFQSGPTRRAALEKTERDSASHCDEVKEMTEFVRASKRGVCAARNVAPAMDFIED